MQTPSIAQHLVFTDPGRIAAYPGNLDFQWQRGIGHGLTNEAVLRFCNLPFECVFEDTVAQEMVVHCEGNGIPVTVNRGINFKRDELVDEFRRVHDNGRFAGFILYETNSFMRRQRGGGVDISMPAIKDPANLGSSCLKRQRTMTR